MQLIAPFFENLAPSASLASISKLLDAAPRSQIDNAPWADFPFKPKTEFAIAHGPGDIFLKYYVTEPFFSPVYRHTNDPVYKDSCVEFFVSFDNDPNYYNLEFNSIGTCLGSYGLERNNRTMIHSAVLEKIERLPQSRDMISKPYLWTLALRIPFSVFNKHQFTSLSGVKCRANFYKCGDDLPTPHFLTWSPIHHPVPNFHLSEYFSELVFK